MKTVKEISIRLQNKPGALSNVSELLGANGINMMALTARNVGDEVTLSFVCNDPARSVGVLESAGYPATVQKVLAAETPHHPGGLIAILKPLKRAGINVEHLYACISFHGTGDSSIMVLAVSDIAAAHEALSKEWITLYGEELYGF